ncbi:protein of unknown function [Paraburkholderia dioscoreae]|uniref:Uncharacterized protein n=1 Tax=Paraburkholderia dioscoreae TaxID=2604047 RepID=A0A5Q4YVE6_9BURK|nr:protein of unknown function [Paraburkholderia dioscoreae]
MAAHHCRLVFVDGQRARLRPSGAIREYRGRWGPGRREADRRGRVELCGRQCAESELERDQSGFAQECGSGQDEARRRNLAAIIESIQGTGGMKTHGLQLSQAASKSGALAKMRLRTCCPSR